MEYPSRQLERLWKLLLLNQFHDVLPGTSIELVEISHFYSKMESDHNFCIVKAHVDAIAYYEDIVNTGNKLLKNGVQSFFDRGKIKSSSVMNTLSWDRSEVVETPDKTLSRLCAILYCHNAY